jgi:PAS domain S-box-containing protein
MGLIINVNKNVTNIFGYTKKKVIGSDIDLLIP